MNGFGDLYKSQQKMNKKTDFDQEEIINQSIKFHLQGNLKEAIKNYQQLIIQGCKDQKVFVNYGLILQGLGKLKEAELLYRKAIEIKPDYEIAYSNLGNLLKDLGKLKEAELSYRKAIEIKPDYSNAYCNLGNILKDLGDLQQAELSYRKAIEIKPDFAEGYLNLGVLLRNIGEVKEAELSYRKAIEIKPDFVEGHLNLGTLLRDIGELQEAELSYRKAIEIKPDCVEAYSNLGSLLNDLGKLQEAELSCRRAIEINPDFANAKINLDLITNNRVPKWHIPMMNDNKRNNAYLKAINRAIKDNKYVLEIGTGSGLLSMMANDAGAQKVVTCEASQPIAEAAERIIATNGYKDKIKVINKKSTELIVGKDLEKKADLIISEILSSEFVGEGVQLSLSDACRRLIKEDGKMIPEAGEIKIALLESSPEIEKELFVHKVNGYDLSEFNNIMGTKVAVNYLGRKITTSFLSEEKVPFRFNFYSKEIINKKEIILEMEVCKSGICLGLITWMRLNLYEDIYFENKPDEKGTSGWINPIYKFNQPLKVLKGQVIKVKSTLLKDRVHYEFL